MIRWDDFEHIHVIKKLKHILGSWWNIDVMFTEENGYLRGPRREREDGDDSFSGSAEGGEKKRIFGKKSFGSKKSFSGPRKSSSGGGAAMARSKCKPTKNDSTNNKKL